MARRFSILVVLLFSLCVSRGEGVHIFPFAEATGQTEAANLLGKGGTKLYGYSIFPQDGFHSQKLTKICKDAAGDDTVCIGRLSSVISGVYLAESGPTFSTIGPLRTKFLLTSGSDRSPPRVS